MPCRVALSPSCARASTINGGGSRILVVHECSPLQVRHTGSLVYCVRVYRTSIVTYKNGETISRAETTERYGRKERQNDSFPKTAERRNGERSFR